MDNQNKKDATKDGKKPIPSWVKSVLELGPLVAFFIAYTMLKDTEFEVFGQVYQGFILATALFIPLLLGSTAILWLLSGTLSVTQIFTAVLVIVFGGLSFWWNDERFFKMKPTLIYLLFSVILGVGLLRGQSYLQVLMGQALPLRAEGWMILTRRFMVFFLMLAVGNEVVWRVFSTSVWVNFKVFGITALMLAFFISQAGVFKRYAKED